MTVYIVDSSDFDWSRGPFDVAAMARDGIVGLTHKATEAANVKHVHLADALNRGRAAGLSVLGAYHVVRTAPGPAAQVQYFFAYLDQAVPWWRTWPGFILQVDLEKWSYDTVSPAAGIAFTQTLRQAKPPSAYVIVYASKGQYGDSLAGIGSPLWNANYPSKNSAPYRSLYTGDSGAGWVTYSGQMPMFWQFASTATVGTQPTCDINAYRGTLAQLQVQIGATMATSNDQLLNGWNPPIDSAGGRDTRGVGIWASDLWRYLKNGEGAYNVGQRDPKTAVASADYLDGMLVAIRDAAYAARDAAQEVRDRPALSFTPEQINVFAAEIGAAMQASGSSLSDTDLARLKDAFAAVLEGARLTTGA
jgi:hypothetical protein